MIAPLGCCQHLGDMTDPNVDPTIDNTTVYATYPADLSYPDTTDPSVNLLDSGNPFVQDPLQVGGGGVAPGSGVNLLDPNNPYIQNPSQVGGGASLATQIANLAASAAKTAASIANPAANAGTTLPLSTLAPASPSFSQWLAEQTLIPGYSNEEILAGGVAAVIVLSLLMSRGKSSGRRK